MTLKPVYGQDSGSIWIKAFLPGSALLSDATIDKKSLAFVDSLMQRDDIEVSFLGGADPINWRLFGRRIKHQVSDTWDQAKKLERASALRQRYNRGQIGTSDEPIRGVKVVWGPKRPDIFKMNNRLGVAEVKLDSLTALLDSLMQEKSSLAFKSNSPTIMPANGLESNYHTLSEGAFASNWEVKTGIMVWNAGGPYALNVPYVGLALKRTAWAIEFQGGLTPWSEYNPSSTSGDAILLGSLHLFPRYCFQLKTGIFSGWRFLSKSDVWIMKIMGLTAGPQFRWKFFETYIGFTFGKLSSLTHESWCNGVLITTNFHLKLN
jgi:hypothetical protein